MDPTVLGPLRVKIRGGTLEHRASHVSLTIDDAGPRVVGRGASCHLRLADDRKVSMAHCELVGTDRGVMVRDLGSKNGTSVNDLLLGPSQHVLLRAPAKIRVGDTILEFLPTAVEDREVGGKFGPFESRSTRTRLIYDALAKVALLRTSVHLTGEPGTGKTFIARAIHNQSPRASKPFVLVDCAGIAPTLAEAELFGYAPGAFTGAQRGGKESPFVEADGGTVLLDEVGDLPLDVQGKFLRFVEELEVKSLGQNKSRKVDVRVISATKHDLAARVNAGLFRDDLYSRLTAARITLPPLRERREDIDLLVQHILGDLGRPDLFDAISKEKRDWLRERPWTGNVRQLRQMLTNVVDLTRHGKLDVEMAIETAYTIAPDHGSAPAEASAPNGTYEVLTARGTSLDAVKQTASRVLLETLDRETGGNVSEISRRADISRDHARELLHEFGIRQVQAPPRRKTSKAD